MAQVTVKVEQQHIAAGNKSAIGSPIALAIRDRLKKPPEVYISVWHGFVRVQENIYTLPPVASAADAAFSNAGTINPFEFRISNKSVNA